VIDLKPHPEGTILPVRARAGARKNEVRGEQDGALKVAVTRAPEKGKANRAITALLAKALALRKSQIELLAGETSPRKQFLVRDVTPDALLPAIERVVAGDADSNG
jgi:uncharacterized protein (TIGR00251 family)